MAPSSPTLPAETAMGSVRLTVADLEGVAAFYERVVGLRALARDGDVVALGASDGPPLVELVGRPGAATPARRASGLFHLALLTPSRLELARALRRVVAAGWALSGASDHLVSEALYLSDPEGNGIELYRDRPREEWGRRDGELAMATLPLDLHDLAGELAGEDSEPDGGMPAGTRMGHVHLQVADLAAAERFYVEALGFEAMVRGYPGALFVAAGGYHHHLGLNTWASADGPPTTRGARGLDRFTIALPDRTALDAAAQRLTDAGHAARGDAEDVVVTDPFGIDVRLAVA
jgi:catechol 2,3-dioxygenase